MSDKKELLFFLNHNRAKFQTLSKDSFKEVANIMKELQAYFVTVQDYESSNLLFTIVQTYYYIDKKEKKNYISDEINNVNSFKNENFLINKGLYILRKERKETLINEKDFIETNITKILLSCLEMKWDKKFVERIAINILTKMEYNDFQFSKNFIKIYKN